MSNTQICDMVVPYISWISAKLFKSCLGFPWQPFWALSSLNTKETVFKLHSKGVVILDAGMWRKRWVRDPLMAVKHTSTRANWEMLPKHSNFYIHDTYKSNVMYIVFTSNKFFLVQVVNLVCHSAEKRHPFSSLPFAKFLRFLIIQNIQNK